MRMTMTYGYDGMTAIKVKILGAVVVPYVATGTLGDINIEKPHPWPLPSREGNGMLGYSV